MKKLIYLILPFFLFFINMPVYSANNLVTKEIKAISVDGFNISATLTYKSDKNKKDYNTVILLHSLGYNSQWWGDLPKKLTDSGFAVLSIDLRGHGKSIYNSKLAKVSWKSLTNYGYSKSPQDIVAVINSINDANAKKSFFNNWAIIGCDLGASSGIIAADSLQTKPKTIVMISPVIKIKGLYVPVKIAQLDNVDFLTICSKDDTLTRNASAYLKKFAQSNYSEITIDSKASGMVMFNNSNETSDIILEWLSQYFD